MVAGEVDPWFGDQCCQARNEVHRFEGHLRGPIPVRCLQGVNHLACGTLYRMSEARRRTLLADKVVFMGISFSVNITMVALEIAMHRNVPIEIVDPRPVEVPYRHVMYHSMTAGAYIQREV